MCNPCCFIIIGGAILGFILLGALVATIVTIVAKKNGNLDTIKNATISMTTTTTEATTTATIILTTTTASLVTCANGYTISPSGTCVNLQIDFNNCGSFNNVCPANSTSCSAGICSNAPAVQLLNAVAIPRWGGNYTVDDTVATVTFPFQLSLYGVSTASVTVNTNGVVCFGSCSNAYANGNLPTSSFGGPTALGYWDDLMIYSGTSQSVYYSTLGSAPNRQAVFEFYESHYSASTNYYHFQMAFFENSPGIVQYTYFQASDRGASATIGVQRSSTGPSITYSVNQNNAVPNNLVLTFNTNNGTYSG